MKRAAFFDIDGTLVECQTQQILAKVMNKSKMLSNLQTVSIFGWFLIYKLGLADNSSGIRRKFYRVFTQYSKKEFDGIFFKACREICREHLRSKMKAVVDQHKQTGDFVFAISGSLSNLCVPICSAFQIDKCFSTYLIVSDGRYTGSWEGNILEGVNKVKLMIQLASEYGFELSNSTCYADSYSDLPMLESVGHPVAVYPDRRLRKHAIRHNWKVIEWES